MNPLSLSLTDLFFKHFRYHLCGKLMFDEFPPGVKQVIFLCTFFCQRDVLIK